jgi:hypothetical protein
MTPDLWVPLFSDSAAVEFFTPVHSCVIPNARVFCQRAEGSPSPQNSGEREILRSAWRAAPLRMTHNNLLNLLHLLIIILILLIIFAIVFHKVNAECPPQKIGKNSRG